MVTTKSQEWLESGIAASKAGEGEKARILLLKVLEVDEQNEQAWLWLSDVVQTDEDRRVCLENVLALNAGNKIAQRGLAQLDNVAEISGTTGELDVEWVTAVSSPSPHQETPTATKPTTSHTDVWDTDEDICAYCAAPVAEEDSRCPRCKRNLISQQYRYPQATSVLYLFWVLLIGAGLFILFQGIYKLLVEKNSTIAILHAFLTGILLLLAVGVYLRLFWAHIISIMILIVALILSVVNFLIPFDPTTLGLEGVDAALGNFASGFVERASITVNSLQLTTTILALFYAIFRAGPEFDRVSERTIAKIKRGPNTATDYHLAARRLSQKGMWASAILHWQKASAIEPKKVVYQRNLARAYIKLGFLERGLNVLQSAKELPMHDDTQAEIEKLIPWVQQQIAVRQAR